MAKALKKVTAEESVAPVSNQGGSITSDSIVVNRNDLEALPENANLINYFFRSVPREKERDRNRRELSTIICKYTAHNPFEVRRLT